MSVLDLILTDPDHRCAGLLESAGVMVLVPADELLVRVEKGLDPENIAFTKIPEANLFPVELPPQVLVSGLREELPTVEFESL